MQLKLQTNKGVEPKIYTAKTGDKMLGYIVQERTGWRATPSKEFSDTRTRVLPLKADAVHFLKQQWDNRK